MVTNLRWILDSNVKNLSVDKEYLHYSGVYKEYKDDKDYTQKNSNC